MISRNRSFKHALHPKKWVKLMSTTGAIVWDARYEAFGKATPAPLFPEVSPVHNLLRFAGQYEDQETGWHYNWHRYYAPELGRYITEDPIGLDGGLNIYGYVDGNPVRFVDPMGLARFGGKSGQWWEFTDRNFQRWFHQCWKYRGDSDATRAELAEAYAEWVNWGRPDGKNGCGGPPPQEVTCPDSEPELAPSSPSSGVSTEDGGICSSWGCKIGVGTVIVGGVACYATGVCGAVVTIIVGVGGTTTLVFQ